MDVIFNRASVRSFTSEPVSESDLEALMRAAMAAPSAGNQQPWEFFIVTSPEMRAALAEASPYAKPAGKAPMAIIVCRRFEGTRFEGCIPQDLSAAIENLLLEAVDLGLGAVWLGIAPEPERMAAVAKAANLPSSVEPFALVAVGHPLEKPEPKCAERYDSERVHIL